MNSPASFTGSHQGTQNASRANTRAPSSRAQSNGGQGAPDRGKPGADPEEAGPIPAPADFVLYSPPALTLVCHPARISLGAAALLTGVHPELLRYYCRLGLLDAHCRVASGEPTFDSGALEEVHRIEHYRRNLGVNRRALYLICELWRQAEREQIELMFLRRL